MKPFLDENFLLTNKTAVRLYHEFARDMPIIDYHNHLPPQEMADDRSFENISRIWLYGDHYKWRAMRINGIPEEFITGATSDRDQFRKWAETVPYTMRNPPYHWTHLELQRYFGIREVLNAGNADRIYDQTAELLQTPDFRVRRLLERMDVRVLCTTDDPVDSLEHHQRIHADGWRIKVLPAFRPDKAMNVDDPVVFNAYLSLLEKAADTSISTFDQYLDALRRRHDYFVQNGCKVSDHGMEHIYAEDYTDAEIRNIFDKIRACHTLTVSDNRKFKSARPITFAERDLERGFVNQ